MNTSYHSVWWMNGSWPSCIHCIDTPHQVEFRVFINMLDEGGSPRTFPNQQHTCRIIFSHPMKWQISYRTLTMAMAILNIYVSHTLERETVKKNKYAFHCCDRNRSSHSIRASSSWRSFHPLFEKGPCSVWCSCVMNSAHLWVYKQIYLLRKYLRPQKQKESNAMKPTNEDMSRFGCQIITMTKKKENEMKEITNKEERERESKTHPYTRICYSYVYICRGNYFKMYD